MVGQSINESNKQCFGGGGGIMARQAAIWAVIIMVQVANGHLLFDSKWETTT